MPSFLADVTRKREGRAKLRRLFAKYPRLDGLSPEEFVTASDAFVAVVEEHPELRGDIPRYDEMVEQGARLRASNEKIRELTEGLRDARKAGKAAREKFDAGYIHLQEVLADALENAKTPEERASIEDFQAIFRRRSW